MKTMIRLTLAYRVGALHGNGYRLVKLTNALLLGVASRTYRVGDYLTENDAQALIDSREYDVTVVPSNGS